MSRVNTVLGPIAAEELGLVAVHEHIGYGMPGSELDTQWWKSPEQRYEETVPKLRRFAEYEAAETSPLYSHLAGKAATDDDVAALLTVASGNDAHPTLLFAAAHRLLQAAELAHADPLPLPYVVKPVREGSSVGVHILRERDNRRAEIAAFWCWGEIIAEPYIPGRELTVAVMEDRALAVTEIATHLAFYDYEAKYADGGSHHTVPAAIHPDAATEAMRVAVEAHRALGCRGVSRADFRYDDTAGEPGRLALLEVNTQPGMTRTSLVPEQAAHCGIAFPDLCAWMVEQARHGA